MRIVLKGKGRQTTTMANNWGADREADMESGVPTIVHAQAVEGNVSIQAEDYEKQVSQRSLWGYSLIDRFAVMLHLRSLPVCCTLTRPPTYISIFVLFPYAAH